MIPLQLSQIRATLGATESGPDADITSVSTDTRTLANGSLFVALRGDNFDGHDHLGQAKNGGAVAAVVDAAPENAPADFPLIVVPDTRAALGRLANDVRRRYAKTRVIAVAGSNGKTGTKRLIHAALTRHLVGTVSPKSFNNDIGVPLTLLPVGAGDDYVVVECGTNHPGEIETLSRIAEPDIAVITNAGPEHLEFLGDLDGVRRENAAVVAGMTPAGCLIVNGDDPLLAAAVGGFGGKVVTFGFDAGNDLSARDVACDFGGVSFTVDDIGVRVPLLGRHVAANALAAVAVARQMGVPNDLIVAGLAEAVGPEMRLDLSDKNGIKILNDAYNANPASVAAALETLRDLPHDGRKIAVLGDMLELGPDSDDYHREAGRQAAACGFDLLACVGPGGRLIADGATGASEAIHFPHAAAAAAGLVGIIKPGDLVLLKASRGVRLEAVAAALSQSPEGV